MATNNNTNDSPNSQENLNSDSQIAQKIMDQVLNLI